MLMGRRALLKSKYNKIFFVTKDKISYHKVIQSKIDLKISATGYQSKKDLTYSTLLLYELLGHTNMQFKTYYKGK